MVIAIFPILLWVSVRDLRTHRIPNSGLVLLSIVALLISLQGSHPWGRHLIASAIVFFITLMGHIFLALGMGDLKFLVILAMLVIPADVESFQKFLIIFSIAAICHLILSARDRAGRERSIPLAPSISLATVALLF